MRRISIVVPAKDEQATLGSLADQIFAAIEALPEPTTAEIIFIDDGSADDSWKVMSQLAETYPANVRAIRMRRNFGKAAGLEAGFRLATGEVVFTMDADLQDDPKEISRFLAKLDEGYDLVSGWKEKRNDPLSKTLPSKLFNAVTSWLTGVKLKDFNCGFKAYRREVIENVRLYGELHRYIPVLAQDAGFRVGQISVEHHPRRHGVTKYGLERYIRGFIDLITVLATTRYLQRPGHMFGGAAVLSGALGVLILAVLSILWLFGEPIGGRPLFFLGLLLVILSVQLISIGVIAELLIRLSVPRDPLAAVIADTRETKPLPAKPARAAAKPAAKASAANAAAPKAATKPAAKKPVARTRTAKPKMQ